MPPLRGDRSNPYSGFNSQGDTLAALVYTPGAEKAVLNLHDPSPGTDLFLFREVLRASIWRFQSSKVTSGEG
jgi:hypothetical protein